MSLESKLSDDSLFSIKSLPSVLREANRINCSDVLADAAEKVEKIVAPIRTKLRNMQKLADSNHSQSQLLGTLFINFMNLFALPSDGGLNLGEIGVSVEGYGKVFLHRKPVGLFIKDPVAKNHFVGEGSFNMYKVQALFSRLHKTLMEQPESLYDYMQWRPSVENQMMADDELELPVPSMLSSNGIPSAQVDLSLTEKPKEPTPEVSKQRRRSKKFGINLVQMNKQLQAVHHSRCLRIKKNYDKFMSESGSRKRYLTEKYYFTKPTVMNYNTRRQSEKSGAMLQGDAVSLGCEKNGLVHVFGNILPNSRVSQKRTLHSSSPQSAENKGTKLFEPESPISLKEITDGLGRISKSFNRSQDVDPCTRQNHGELSLEATAEESYSNEVEHVERTEEAENVLLGERLENTAVMEIREKTPELQKKDSSSEDEEIKSDSKPNVTSWAKVVRSPSTIEKQSLQAKPANHTQAFPDNSPSDSFVSTPQRKSSLPAYNRQPSSLSTTSNSFQKRGSISKKNSIYSVNGSFIGKKKKAKDREEKLNQKPSQCLFVGNLSYTASLQDIEDLKLQFKSFGKVIDFSLNKQKGVLWVNYASTLAATRALTSMDQKQFLNRPLYVDYSHMPNAQGYQPENVYYTQQQKAKRRGSGR